MFSEIYSYCTSVLTEKTLIPAERRRELASIAHYISEKQQADEDINLMYICTHNSRRSQFGQVWAQVAAHYFSIGHFHSFSGGTEVTEVNRVVLQTLVRIGFKVSERDDDNTLFDVFFDDNESVRCFSKTYDNKTNPRKNFAAIMTCEEADVNCPYVPGAERRFTCSYADPKKFDGTPQQDTAYERTCREIARETVYLFSQIKK